MLQISIQGTLLKCTETMSQLCNGLAGMQYMCGYHLTSTKYSDLRSDLFNVAKDLIINFDNLDSECKFITILKSDEIHLVQELAKCIYYIFKRRIEHVNAGHVNLDDSNICSNT